MIERCNNKNSKSYKLYGAKGVAVCEEWMNIENFIKDMSLSYKKCLSLDRINPYGNYEKHNCRWASQTIQNRNTRLIQRNNTTGFRGVGKFKEKFRAYISINYKQIHLGYFSTAIDAAKAYDTYVIANNLEHTINGVLND
jgi:hypothetical protein